MSFINYLKLMASVTTITSLNNEFEWTNKKYFTNE